MGMFSFIKEAGEKLFGIGKAEAAQPAAPTAEQSAALSKTAGETIVAYIHSMGLKVDALDVSFDAASGAVTVSGVAPDQATREKVVLCCGNVSQVTEVHDLMTVSAPVRNSTILPPMISRRCSEPGIERSTMTPLPSSTATS